MSETVTKVQTPGFRITGGKGFQITFDNGWCLSVQFGWGNYHSARFRKDFSSTKMEEIDREYGQLGSPDAEIAIFDPAGEMFNFGNDTVKGWVKPEEVAHWTNWVSDRLPNERVDTVRRPFYA